MAWKQFEQLGVGILRVGAGDRQIRSTTKVTRATVLAEVDDGFNNPAVGSLILSTDRAYLRVAADSANTDFEKITTSGAD